jgi:hypothetical protein
MERINRNGLIFNCFLSKLYFINLFECKFESYLNAIVIIIKALKLLDIDFTNRNFYLHMAPLAASSLMPATSKRVIFDPPP